MKTTAAVTPAEKRMPEVEVVSEDRNDPGDTPNRGWTSSAPENKVNKGEKSTQGSLGAVK